MDSIRLNKFVLLAIGLIFYLLIYNIKSNKVYGSIAGYYAEIH